AGLVASFPGFFGVGYPTTFLFGPLVYLYAITAADRERHLTRRDALHFVPFGLSVLFGLPVYVLNSADKLAFAQRVMSGEVPMFIAVQDPLKYVSGIAYTVATILFLRRHRERVKESYSSTERVNLRWLLVLGLSAAGIWALAVALDILDSTGVLTNVVGDDWIGLAMSAFIYAIA